MGGVFYFYILVKYYVFEYFFDFFYVCIFCDLNKLEFYECRSWYLLYVCNCSFNLCCFVIERLKEIKLK